MKKSLATRSNIYYAVTGLKLLGTVGACVLVLVAEFFIMYYGNDELFKYQMNTLVMLAMMFLVMFNGIFSLYSANWTDSMVLSMGARRKDIFRGQIIKTVVAMVLGTGVVIAAMYLTDQMDHLRIVIGMAIAAFPISALFYALGHKIRKFGKLGFVVIIMAATIGGILFGFNAATPGNPLAAFVRNLNTGAIIGIAVVLYLLFELWAYKLNKKSMVH